MFVRMKRHVLGTYVAEFHSESTNLPPDCLHDSLVLLLLYESLSILPFRFSGWFPLQYLKRKKERQKEMKKEPINTGELFCHLQGKHILKQLSIENALYSCTVCEFYNEEKARKYHFYPHT